MAIAGAFAAYREAVPFVFAGADAAERTASLISGDLQPGLSFQSHQQVLENCTRLFGTLYVKIRPTLLRTQLAEACKGLAEDAVAAMPSYAFGWFVAAQTAIELKDNAAFNAAMLRSQATGPSEQWIAELRVALIEDNYAVASPEILQREIADLKMLVRSERGVASIARRYFDKPEFRERITTLVETRPAADQNLFVYFLHVAVSPR